MIHCNFYGNEDWWKNYNDKNSEVDEALKNNVLQFPTKWTPKVIDGGLDKPTK